MNLIRYIEQNTEQNKTKQQNNINKENYVQLQWWFGFQLKEVELDETLPIKGKMHVVEIPSATTFYIL